MNPSSSAARLVGSRTLSWKVWRPNAVSSHVEYAACDAPHGDHLPHKETRTTDADTDLFSIEESPFCSDLQQLHTRRRVKYSLANNSPQLSYQTCVRPTAEWPVGGFLEATCTRVFGRGRLTWCLKRENTRGRVFFHGRTECSLTR